MLLRACICCIVFCWAISSFASARRLGIGEEEERLIGWKGETYKNTADVILKSVSSQELLMQHDRWIETISLSPRAFLFHNFLTHAECDHVIKLVEPSVSRSYVVDSTTGASKLDPVRTSYGGSIGLGQDELIANIEQKIAEWTHLPPVFGEQMQVLRYVNGQKYDAHWDWFDDPQHNRSADGNRLATVLMYLAEVEEGGETTLPLADPVTPDRWTHQNLSECASQMGIAIKPRKGDAILFWDLKMDFKSGERAALHASCPTLKGTKWTATKWIHNKPVSPYYDPLEKGRECADSKAQCTDWAKEGKCDTDPSMVGLLGSCRKSCGDCIMCSGDDVLCMRQNIGGRKKPPTASNGHEL